MLEVADGSQCLSQQSSLTFAGDYKTSFHAKAEAIAEALKSGEYGFAFLHVKAIDDTGHDKAAAMKVCAQSSRDNIPNVSTERLL